MAPARRTTKRKPATKKRTVAKRKPATKKRTVTKRKTAARKPAVKKRTVAKRVSGVEKEFVHVVTHPSDIVKANTLEPGAAVIPIESLSKVSPRNKKLLEGLGLTAGAVGAAAVTRGVQQRMLSNNIRGELGLATDKTPQDYANLARQKAAGLYQAGAAKARGLFK